jgi:hypothetical protein
LTSDVVCVYVWFTAIWICCDRSFDTRQEQSRRHSSAQIPLARLFPQDAIACGSIVHHSIAANNHTHAPTVRQLPRAYPPARLGASFVPKAGVGDRLLQTTLPANHNTPATCGAAVPQASSPTSLVRERGLESPPKLHGQRMQPSQTRAAVGLRIGPITRPAASKPRPFPVTGESGACCESTSCVRCVFFYMRLYLDRAKILAGGASPCCMIDKTCPEGIKLCPPRPPQWNSESPRSGVAY